MLQALMLILFALLILGLLYRVKTKQTNTPPRPLDVDNDYIIQTGAKTNAKVHSPPARYPFRCVTIVQGKHACHEVKSLNDQQFLSQEAPELPLASCDVSTCSCHYHHQEDRRYPLGSRRVGFGTIDDFITPFDDKNLRTPKKGRRRQDT